MQDVIDADVRRSNQVENYYRECLDKAINRIKRAYEEKQCTQMTLKHGEIVGLKRIFPPHSMHYLVKVVRLGLERAGVRAYKCCDPHHLVVELGSTSGNLLSQSLSKQLIADSDMQRLTEGRGSFLIGTAALCQC